MAGRKREEEEEGKAHKWVRLVWVRGIVCALTCVGEIAQRLAEGLDLRGKLQIRKEQGGGGWWRC